MLLARGTADATADERFTDAQESDCVEQLGVVDKLATFIPPSYIVR
jgi:hypothetical protein